jgi:hypothetical protein
MRYAVGGLLATLIPTVAFAAEDTPMAWPEAVAELAGERTRAEDCVRVFKRHVGDEPAALSRGELDYGEAKADMDEVIAALIVAVAKGDEPISINNLDARLNEAVAGREAFCAEVKATVPDDSGTKGIFGDLVSGAIGPVIEAATAIYLHYRDEDMLTRKTIETQIKSTEWPAFAAVTP